MAGQRVMVFIDGSNFYHGLKKTFGKANVDFYKLGELLADPEELVQLYFYTAPTTHDMGECNRIQQQKFLEALKLKPKVTVKLGRFLKREKEYEITCPKDNCKHTFKWIVETYEEKGVDVYLAVDMIRYAYDNLYDIGIVLSADGDLAKAVEVAKSLNRNIVNVAFRKQKSYHLMQAATSYRYLEDIIVPKVFLDFTL